MAKNQKFKRSLKSRINRVMKIGEFRTVTSFMRSMKVTRSEVEDAVEESERLDLIVGIRAGNGIASWDRTDFQIEKYQ